MASASMAPSTPPPPSSIRTPHAPRLGFHDDWEPFTPRKSARLSAQRSSARTPSPPPLHRQPLASPRTTKKTIIQSNAAMSSPATSSPRKKRQPASDSVHRASGDFTSEATSSTAAALGFKDKPISASVSRTAGMLPTPSKTPQKPPTEQAVANIKSFARNLFPSEETAISSPRKKRSKKYTGMSMESFTAEEIEEPIEIFTDSQDRIPKKDENESNPFYNAAQVESPPRRSKRRQVMIPGEGAQSIDDASRRDDGLIYVFRGKKFFRKFADPEVDELEDSEDELEAHLGRRLTRSSIKPRLLFPTQKAQKTKEMLEEEEAATDVEEEEVEVEAKEEEANPKTPVKAKAERAQTPEAPKFAPRTTKKSPFDSWRRTKEPAATTTATKRQGEPLASANVKRTRA
ncbi:hypothetical protein PT974_11969 [Cladobotryum mycophilum]|uniref:DNA replication regulator SLD2 n=1 Tax=Cladobotryum mycophilum TaxID=491253 RepID=A0ABR0S6Q8_9HYPO